MKQNLGFCIRHVSHLIKRIADRSPAKRQMEPVTGMHGWVIGYLYDHRHEDTFQRDLEQVFQMRRSTASGILQLMEKNELITRESVKQDARLKKLVLTQKALDLHENFGQDLQRIDSRMIENVDPDDLATFQRVLKQLTQNLEAYEQEQIETEVLP